MAGTGGLIDTCTVSFMPTILGNGTIKDGRTPWIASLEGGCAHYESYSPILQSWARRKMQLDARQWIV